MPSFTGSKKVNKERIVRFIRFTAIGIGFVASYILALIAIPRRKSVLIIPEDITKGGTGTYFFYLTEFLKGKNYVVSILISEKDNSDSIVNYCREKRIKKYVYGKEIQQPELWYNWNHPLRKYFLRDFLSQATLFNRYVITTGAKRVFVSSSRPCSLFSALAIPRRINYIMHYIPWGRIDTGNGKVLSSILNKRKQLIFVSDFARNKTTEYWSLDQRKASLHTIHNYYPDVKHSKSRNNESLQILTIGSVTRDKNPLLWIRIANEILNRYSGLNICFTWLGGGTLQEECRSLTSGSGSIVFKGHVNDVDAFYIRSSIYFQPSKRESHGIAVLGSMAHGIPAIATDFGGTRESIVHGISGFLVNVSDEKEMIDAICKLVENRDLRIRMGNKARERYETCFTRRSWELKMEKLL